MTQAESETVESAILVPGSGTMAVPSFLPAAPRPPQGNTLAEAAISPRQRLLKIQRPSPARDQVTPRHIVLADDNVKVRGHQEHKEHYKAQAAAARALVEFSRKGGW